LFPRCARAAQTDALSKLPEAAIADFERECLFQIVVPVEVFNTCIHESALAGHSRIVHRVIQTTVSLPRGFYRSFQIGRLGCAT
jgi:hypothetical protein